MAKMRGKSATFTITTTTASTGAYISVPSYTTTIDWNTVTTGTTIPWTATTIGANWDTDTQWVMKYTICPMCLSPTMEKNGKTICPNDDCPSRPVVVTAGNFQICWGFEYGY